MPATNAASECSFSVLRKIKSYLRSIMTQQRLKHLMILNINKDSLDEMDLKSIANESVQWNEHRLSVLGNFKELNQCGYTTCNYVAIILL